MTSSIPADFKAFEIEDALINCGLAPSMVAIFKDLLSQSKHKYSLAYKKFLQRDSDTKFYNASLSTLLDVYPIINYEEYIKNNNVAYEKERLSQAAKFWDKPHQFKID